MAQVHEIHSRGGARGRDASRSFRGRGEFHRPIPRSAGRGYGDRPCPSCLMEHPYRQCPAFARMCYYCSNMNHFESACRARIRDQGQGHGFVNRGQGSGRVSQGHGGRTLSRGGQSYLRGSSSGRGNMNYNQVHAVHTVKMKDYTTVIVILTQAHRKTCPKIIMRAMIKMSVRIMSVSRAQNMKHLNYIVYLSMS